MCYYPIIESTVPYGAREIIIGASPRNKNKKKQKLIIRIMNREETTILWGC